MATTNFPTSLDTISSLPNPGSGDFTTAPSHASQHDVENDALRAIEAKVGIGASTPTASTVLRATGTGTTAYAQVGLTTDVTGTLPVANGGTGITTLGSGVATFLGTPSSANLTVAVTDETGTGLLVFNSSPTIVTPTIASFTNAQHNHSNAAGGGNIPGSSITSNSIPISKLSTGTTELGYVSSSPASVIPNAYTTYATVTATSTGGKVRCTGNASIKDGASGASRTGHVRVQLDGSTITDSDIIWNTTASNMYTFVATMAENTPSAASHSWTLQVEADTASASLIQVYQFSVVEVI